MAAFWRPLTQFSLWWGPKNGRYFFPGLKPAAKKFWKAPHDQNDASDAPDVNDASDAPYAPDALDAYDVPDVLDVFDALDVPDAFDAPDALRVPRCLERL